MNGIETNQHKNLQHYAALSSTSAFEFGHVAIIPPSGGSIIGDSANQTSNATTSAVVDESFSQDTNIRAGEEQAPQRLVLHESEGQNGNVQPNQNAIGTSQNLVNANTNRPIPKLRRVYFLPSSPTLIVKRSSNQKVYGKNTPGGVNKKKLPNLVPIHQKTVVPKGTTARMIIDRLE